jgi:hypothetical protein
MEEQFQITKTNLTLNEWLMKPKSIKVILICPMTKTIEEKFIDGSLESIYNLIGCDLFEVVNVDGFTDIYVDEEGAINNTKSGFVLNGKSQPIFGRGLVVGTPDKKGNMTPTNLTPEGAKNMISHWFTIG